MDRKCRNSILSCGKNFLIAYSFCVKYKVGPKKVVSKDFFFHFLTINPKQHGNNMMMNLEI